MREKWMGEKQKPHWSDVCLHLWPVSGTCPTCEKEKHDDDQNKTDSRRLPQGDEVLRGKTRAGWSGDND